MNAVDVPQHKMVWVNIFFFTITTLVAVIGAPFYIYQTGSIHPATLWLTAFYLVATGMSITVGYHRLFAHATYRTNPVLEFLLLFFGAAAYEQSAFYWASQHRTHHQFVDTDKDPYSIKKGFFYAHIGWLLFWKHPEHFENVKDLQKNPLVMNQYKYYPLWSAVSGIILPVLIGMCYGDVAGAFIFTVCARLVAVHHSTFAINSICHTFGRATYDIYSSAKDHWLVALITNGEGYHNFHHHFPGDYRNGVRWYHWDPSKWTIALFARLGLAWDLKKVSSFRIIATRLAAEKQRAEDSLQGSNLPNLASVQAALKSHYEKLRVTLGEWESAVREYQVVFRQQLERCSEKRREAAARRAEARRQFRETLQQWKTIHVKLAAA